MNLEQKIEAVLFWKGEPMSVEKLVEIFKVSKDEIASAVGELSVRLADRGIVLLAKEGEITLGTNPGISDLIENLQKEEFNKNLSKASLETLSIVLYKNGATRSEIDYIRGVNSSFTLRALSMRGLVEKIVDKKDSRRYIYKPTFETLSFMGIKSPEELPDYDEVNGSVEIIAEELKEEIENEQNEQ
ncbi:SMC-Scp complex subunit ScpB [Patescibacteria group bacterium]|nr:SMC-Scp complex subunit ScpB [Patescibacteria group bacterium]MBU1727854.1 SMC-Scp complex subunit ScpB [Patescibacteria group bacterium]